MFELTVPVNELAAHLKWVSDHCPTRPAVPVLAGIRLSVTEGRLALDATDHKTWASARVEADTSGEGIAVLPGRLLSTLVAKLPADRELRLEIEEATARLRCGPVNARLHTLAADEYPAPPEVPNTVGRCEASDLAPATARVAATAGTDDAIPHLIGMQLVFGDDGLSLASTDRYQASHATVPWTPTISAPEAGPKDSIVAAATLARAARGLIGDVDLAAGDDLIGLITHARTLMMRCLDYEFPKVEAFLDSARSRHTATVIVETTVLTAAVERARLFSPASVPITLHVAGNEATVRGGQEGEETAETLPVEVEGELDEDGVTLGMNAGYLLGALSGTRSEQARLALATETKPVIATGTDSDDRNWNVLMPLRLSGRR
ncbi:hypothetical protein IDM40_08425 [Nocardiopsis sp. HNM0947]|uniref:Uncharacterized protein n=1 Tax=Nocardiopsis coralli TaxID=2772213 RepID=A0ABR9P4G5_9ACTN|nr:hypothetical protein [Nocardiopsis coralli]MBE2998726.1 hypothetical protein [Nocardiopsis coralli]